MRRSNKSREGELFIDHRASPGLTPEDLGGFGIAVGKGQLFESAIQTCGHCQAMIVRHPKRTRARGWCAQCDKYVCDACAYRLHRTLECRTIAKQLDETYEALERGSTLLLTALSKD